MTDPISLTFFSTTIGLILGYIFKFKCSHFECCYGIVKFDRDIDAEIELEEYKNRNN